MASCVRTFRAVVIRKEQYRNSGSKKRKHTAVEKELVVATKDMENRSQGMLRLVLIL